MAKQLTPEKLELIRTKDYFDCIAPSTIKFMNNYYIVGDSYRCVWAIREYPPSTEEQAMLSKIADRNGVTLRIYHRLVDAMEQKRIVQMLNSERVFGVLIPLALRVLVSPRKVRMWSLRPQFQKFSSRSRWYWV